MLLKPSTVVFIICTSAFWQCLSHEEEVAEESNTDSQPAEDEDDPIAQWKKRSGQPQQAVCCHLGPHEHCCQIAEISAKKLKYSGRKKIFTARNWSGTLAEIAEK
jgi:hypothetical protein